MAWALSVSTSNVQTPDSPRGFGHAALSDMIRTYPDLVMNQQNGTGIWVSLKPKADGTET